LEACPRSGRTHQIRVHLAAIGHPVAGDPLYGKRDPLIGRIALHTWRLALDHPTTGQRMLFEAPLPADLAAALEALGIEWGRR
jgi:23S rRNA pseudouridine1911/1915/1917 synthase